MDKLGLKLTNKLLNTISEWFSTYLNAYGLTDKTLNWMIKHNIQYKPDILDGDRIKPFICADIINPKPDTPIDFSFKDVFDKSALTDKIWGFEQWKKSIRRQ